MLAAVLLAISSVIYQATQCGTNTHTHANTYAAVFNKNSQKKCNITPATQLAWQMKKFTSYTTTKNIQAHTSTQTSMNTRIHANAAHSLNSLSN